MNGQNAIDIYGHRPGLSFRVAAGRDHYSKAIKLKWNALKPFNRALVRIHVNEYNFLYLKEMVDYCLSFLPEKKRNNDKMDNLGFLGDIVNHNIVGGFKAYAARLNQQLNERKIKIHIDKNLATLLECIEDKINKDNWADFFQRIYFVRQHSVNLNDELRILGALLDRAFIGPIDLVLDLIHVCNTNCVHCWIHSPNASKNLSASFKGQIMAFETIKSIVDDASRIGVNAITLLGDGEPLLHPNFIEILSYIRRKHPFMNTIAFTNGLCLSKSISKQLIHEGLNQLTCSLAAASPGTYARVCSKPGVQGFHQIVDNLKTLHRLKTKARPHRYLKPRVPEVTLAFVLHGLNYHEIIEMAHLAGKVGADAIRFQLIHLDDDNRQLRLEPVHLKFLMERIDQAARIADDYGMTFQPGLSFQLDHINASQGEWSENVYLEKGCFIGWAFSIIKANDDLGLCCALKKIGNIAKLGFRANWESGRYDKYRTAAKYLNANAGMLFEESSYQKEENGFRLFSGFCRQCDNHGQNNYMLGLLEQSGLAKYIGK